MLPYTPANTSAYEKSKILGERIGEYRAMALLKALVEAIEVMKVETVGNTLDNEKAEAIQNIPA